MAWTAPRTWVTSEVVTASNMNTHVRDNFLETAPAKAVAASAFIVTDGANSILQRTPELENVDTSETTASTSYVDLATVHSESTTTGTRAMIFIKAGISNNTAGAVSYMSYAISGASTASASDIKAVAYESSAANDFAQMGTLTLQDGLNAGVNTWTMKHRVTAGTGTFQRRGFVIIPL